MRNVKFAAAVLIAVFIAVPMFGARGSANFSKLVTLGDSYGAGFSSGSLNERHQVWSWPAVLARQVGYKICPANATAADNCFAVPLVSYPGIAPELVLTSLAPTIVPASTTNGTPLMTTFGRPYNNLAIPGGTLNSLLTIKGNEPPSNSTPVIFGQFILRGLGTEIEQALVQHPTFIAMWAGGNDFLGSVLAGTDQGLTSAADFKTRYEQILDTLIAGAPNAGIVVGTLPTNPTGVPVVSTIPPFIVDPATRQPVLVNGQLVYYLYDAGNGQVAPLPPGSLVLLTAQTRLATGFGFPPVPPFTAFPNAGKPLPASDVLTPTELATIIGRIAEYNSIITTAASARNIPVADIKGLFDRVAVNPLTGAGGLTIGPIKVTSSYISGGFYSLDGFHLTDLGYLLFANEYIKTINSAYDTEVPLASITQLFANNGAFFPETTSGQMVFNADGFELTSQAAEQITSMWANPTLKKLRRTRH
jgi:lysophospholipase L1-like esterase